MASFGLILPIQRRGHGLDVLLEELGEEVLAAERAGFDAVFLTEFHQAHGGALVSPLLVLAWLGARTTRISWERWFSPGRCTIRRGWPRTS